MELTSCEQQPFPLASLLCLILSASTVCFLYQATLAKKVKKYFSLAFSSETLGIVDEEANYQKTLYLHVI